MNKINKYKKALFLGAIVASLSLVANTAMAATTIYASSVTGSNQLLKKDGSAITDPARTDSSKVLGAPDSLFFSLGFGGSVTIELADYVGTNLSISTYEITNGAYPLETASVEVSQNGTTWTLAGTVDNQSGAGPNPHTDTVSLSSGTCIKYVRITDTSDPAPHAANADGFDVDAISATYDETCVPPPPPCDTPDCCGGDVTVTNTNSAVVVNNVSSSSNTGNNFAGGSEGGNGGSGGDIQTTGGKVKKSNTGNGGKGGDGGSGGTVVTGNAKSKSGAVNVVNTNATRIRR